MTEKVGGWRDYRELNLAPEIELFRRAQAAGFDALFVPRLTVLKFPAAQRKNVYRERPFHEQSVWLERIRSDIDFEATQLARMIATDQTTRALPVRRLIRILAHVLKKRLRWRLTRRSGYKGLLWFAKGAGIGRQKQYKGLE